MNFFDILALLGAACLLGMVVGMVTTAIAYCTGQYWPTEYRTGLHASLHPFDALRYAPGDTLCISRHASPSGPDHQNLRCSR